MKTSNLTSRSIRRKSAIKGVSPIIATVILISIVVIIAAIVGPWAYQLAQRATNQTGSQIEKDILCRNTAYDFVPDFGINGIDYDFSGPQSQDYLRAMIRNQGKTNLYDFYFEARINAPEGLIIKNFDVTHQSQKTRDDPLKPGETVLLTASITENINGTLERLTILSGLNCPPVSQDVQ